MLNDAFLNVRLHSLLKKLQSINSESQPAVKEKHKHKASKHAKPEKSDKQEKQEKHAKPEKSDKQEKQEKSEKQDKSDKTKGVKRKHSHSDKTKSSDSGKQKKTVVVTDGVASDSVATAKRRSSVESVETTGASSHKRKSVDSAESSDVSKQKKTKAAESAKGDKNEVKGDKTEVKKADVVPGKKEKKEKDEERPEINITENTGKPWALDFNPFHANGIFIKLHIRMVHCIY